MRVDLVVLAVLALGGSAGANIEADASVCLVCSPGAWGPTLKIWEPSLPTYLHLHLGVHSQATSTCSLHAISDDVSTCGQSDIDCKYETYAKLAEPRLEDGTCSDQGYTILTSTATKTYSVGHQNEGGCPHWQTMIIKAPDK